MLPFVVGVLGLIIGSFLNVVVLRYGEESLGGRSKCAHCGHTIRWYDLIPVLSWIILRGKCRDCGHWISIQYPLVEAGTGILFFLIASAPLSLPFLVLALPIAALLIAIAVHDFYTTIIPDPWVILLGIFSLIAAVAGAVYTESSVMLALVAGPITALPLFLLWLVSKGQWMGLGDAKLALSFGWLLGIGGGIFSVFFAFILGTIISIPLLVLSKVKFTRGQKNLEGSPHETEKEERSGQPQFTMKSEIPFGPYLVVSCFFVWLLQLYGLEIPIFSALYGI